MTLAIKSLGLIEVICDNPYIRAERQNLQKENHICYNKYSDRA